MQAHTDQGRVKAPFPSLVLTPFSSSSILTDKILPLKSPSPPILFSSKQANQNIEFLNAFRLRMIFNECVFRWSLKKGTTEIEDPITMSERGKVYEAFENRVNSILWNKDRQVPIIPAFHGTSLAIAKRICQVRITISHLPFLTSSSPNLLSLPLPTFSALGQPVHYNLQPGTILTMHSLVPSSLLLALSLLMDFLRQDSVL